MRHRPPSRALCLGVLVLGLSAVTPVAAHAAGSGTLDRSFAGDGTLTSSVGAWSAAYAVAVQPDGKIVVAGFSYGPDRSGAFALSRFGADGSLDTSFSRNGKVRTRIGVRSTAYGMTLQPDGKIVAVGYSTRRSGGEIFAVARYRSDGSLDTGFAGDGIRTTALSPVMSDYAEDVAIQPDGRIVVVGETQDRTGGFRFAVTRYTAEGRLDTTFGGDGVRLTSFTRQSRAASVALAPDGSILVGGSVGGTRSRIGLARFAPDGSLDTSFSANGRFTVAVGRNSGASAVAIQPDGRILVAGMTGATIELPGAAFVLLRLDAQGSLDPSFAADGIRTTRIGHSAAAHALVLQPDGRVVVAGEALADSKTFDVALARYLANGTLDPSFSGDGLLTTSIRHDAWASAVALQPDGRIVVAGESPNRIAVARYLAP